MSSDYGITYLELTDAESRLIRKVLEEVEACGDNRGIQAYNRGIIRGTERLAREFMLRQRAKKK